MPLSELFGGIVFNLISFPFLLGIGNGSLQYYVAVSNASDESVNELLNKFKFHLSFFFDSEDREKAIRLTVETASVREGYRKRILYSCIPVIWILWIVSGSILNPLDIATMSIRTVWVSIYITNIISMWRLGHSLMAETTNRQVND